MNQINQFETQKLHIHSVIELYALPPECSTILHYPHGKLLGISVGFKLIIPFVSMPHNARLHQIFFMTLNIGCKHTVNRTHATIYAIFFCKLDGQLLQCQFLSRATGDAIIF